MTRFRLVLGVAVMLVLATVDPAAAQVDGGGDEGAVSAVLTTAGVRSVASVTPLVLSGALSALPVDDYAVVVAEAARTGTNPWSVTGRMCGPNAGNPLVSDCTGFGDELVLSTNSAVTLAGSAMAIDTRAVSELVPGGSGTLAAPSGSETLAAARTLFTNTNQLTTALYTETYTATGNVTLSPPNETATGTYSGFFVVTLVQ